jgi:hypothetical protein
VKVNPWALIARALVAACFGVLALSRLQANCYLFWTVKNGLTILPFEYLPNLHQMRQSRFFPFVVLK